MVTIRQGEEICRPVGRSDCPTVTTTAKVWVLFGVLKVQSTPAQERASGWSVQVHEQWTGAARLEGNEAGRKWLVDPGIKVDVGSSYHCVAEGTTCRIVHPLIRNVSWV